jgi:AcrR family transcriptional regulator
MTAKRTSDGAGPPAARRRDQEVIDAAAKVFYERGYAAASVQHVADELGILKGSLYHYIASKEDLLFGILEEVHREVAPIIVEVASRDDLDALGRIALYVRRTIDYNLRHILKITVYYQDVERLSEPRRASIFGQRREHEAFLSALISEAQQAGQCDPSLDATILTNCIFGSLIWSYRWYRPRPTSAQGELAELCTQFVLRGLTGNLDGVTARARFAAG